LSAVQVFEIVAAIAIIAAVATGAGLFLVYKRLDQYQRNQHVILGSRGTVDIVEHVASVDEKVGNLRLALEDLTVAVRDHDVRIDTCLSRVGVVRFDAYEDLGGRQSTTMACLNSLGDGAIITTVVSRDFSRMYVKLLKNGEPDIPLAPEEAEALEQAKGSGPFVIRPRPQTDTTDGFVKPADETTAIALDAPASLGLPGKRKDSDRALARENRRRKRHGLPPLEQETTVASAAGWTKPHTPNPAAATSEPHNDLERETGDGL
jgi:hypothetical protein